MEIDTSGPTKSGLHTTPVVNGSASLRVVVSGTVMRRVLHVAGELTESGSRLVVALAEQSIRDGCLHLRIDLSGVTVIDLAALRSLRQFQAVLHFQAILRDTEMTLRFSDPSHRIAPWGLATTYTAGSAEVLG